MRPAVSSMPLLPSQARLLRVVCRLNVMETLATNILHLRHPIRSAVFGMSCIFPHDNDGYVLPGECKFSRGKPRMLPWTGRK